MKSKIVVVGASGMAGRYFIQHAERHHPDWSLVAIARRPLDFASKAQFFGLDLTDAAASRQVFSQISGVTAMVFAGFINAPDWLAQVAPNRQILINALAGLEAGDNHLQRVVLIQGMKYYGSHLGAFKTPAREDDPRHMPPNYYYAQQDILEAAQQKAAKTSAPWHWTCLRPHVIAGYGARSSQNLLTVLGVYASLCKALNLPLCFPGSPGAFGAINQATDARLLARAIAWSLQEPACANQAFNITNGDYFRWEHLWPKIAQRFGLTTGPVRQLDLASQMADKAPVWQALVRQHQLLDTPFEQLVHWPFADYILRTDWDVMANTTKARQAGFADCLDTEAMYLELLSDLQARQVLPPADQDD
ncbi:MAG: SDR family oxidoreductase [Burkholderiaceae bacterium]